MQSVCDGQVVTSGAPLCRDTSPAAVLEWRVLNPFDPPVCHLSYWKSVPCVESIRAVVALVVRSGEVAPRDFTTPVARPVSVWCGPVARAGGCLSLVGPLGRGRSIGLVIKAHGFRGQGW